MTSYRLIRPKAAPLIAMLAACALFFSLGVWQIERLHWKEALLARITTSFTRAPEAIDDFLAPGGKAPEEFLRVRFRMGEILPQELHLGARYRHKQLGYEIVVPVTYLPVTPDRDSGEKPVIAFVNIGWVPVAQKNAAREALYKQFSGKEFTGMLRAPGKHGWLADWVLPDNRPKQNLWFWYDMDAMRAALPDAYLQYHVFPYVISLLPPESGALPEGAPVPFSAKDIHIRNHHLQYAITWFVIGFACLVVFITYHLKKEGAES
jgi:surfeit locus 1 family protein